MVWHIIDIIVRGKCPDDHLAQSVVEVAVVAVRDDLALCSILLFV